MSEPDEGLTAVFEDCPFPEWREFSRAWGNCRTVWGGDAWYSYFWKHEWIPVAFVKWIWDRGYLIHVVHDKRFSRFRSQLTPKTRVDARGECFHATRTCNVENILRCGLLPGRECIRSQTERPDAGNYIHAALTLSDARDWATKEKLLGIDVPAMLRVDLEAADTGLLRDPFSTTGYIVNTFHVQRQFIYPVPLPQ